MACKVLVVDDRRMARQLFETIIVSSGRYTLAGSLDSSRGAAEICREREAEIVLLRMVFSDGSFGLDLVGKFREKCPDAKLVVVTSVPEVSFPERAWEAGVDSFWYEETPDQPLLTLMELTMEGKRIFPKKTPPLMLGNLSSNELTAEELQVLREMTTGASNVEISEKLHISERSIKRYITSLLKRTGFRNRTILAINARVSGLVIGSSR